jgi:acyl dehydratase
LAEESLISQELRDLLGQEGKPESFEVEKGHIRRFAQAVGDPNPLWNDLERARQSRYGNIIAPPTFLIDAATIELCEKLKGPPGSFINASTEIEYLRPIFLGDTITTTARLIDLKEKTKNNGKLLIMLTEFIYKNQREETVRICRNTFMKVMSI